MVDRTIGVIRQRKDSVIRLTRLENKDGSYAIEIEQFDPTEHDGSYPITFHQDYIAEMIKLLGNAIPKEEVCHGK